MKTYISIQENHTGLFIMAKSAHGGSPRSVLLYGVIYGVIYGVTVL